MLISFLSLAQKLSKLKTTVEMFEVDGDCYGGGVFEFVDVLNVAEIVPFLSRLHYFRVLVGQVGSSSTLSAHLDIIVVPLSSSDGPFCEKI